MLRTPLPEGSQSPLALSSMLLGSPRSAIRTCVYWRRGPRKLDAKSHMEEKKKNLFLVKPKLYDQRNLRLNVEIGKF